jgi:hypothetical protein
LGTFQDDVVRLRQQIHLGSPGLTRGFPVAPAEVSIHELPDEQATRAAILAALREMAETAGPADTVIIIFACHGYATSQNYYLFPYDAGVTRHDYGEAEVERARTTLISERDLSEALRNLSVHRAALVFDSCYSGVLGTDWNDSRAFYAPSGMATMAYKKGIAILVASNASDTAIEPSAIQHGALSFALLSKGIVEGAAAIPHTRAIEWDAWLSYAADETARLNSRLGAFQTRNCLYMPALNRPLMDSLVLPVVRIP